MSAIISAAIAAVTAVVVALLTNGLTARRERRAKLEDERQGHNKLYVNPLRISLAENLFRTMELRARVSTPDGIPALQVIELPAEVASKDTTWFNGPGAYLASSTYYAACVFANIARLRAELPYLNLKSADDSALLTNMRRVSVAYSKDLGVFFATQDAIGEVMRDERGVHTYFDYCAYLTDEQVGPWLHRLIQYYLDVGKGRYLDRADQLIVAMRELLDFLDSAAGTKSSIEAIRSAER